jgi:hypothetical protein
MTVVETLADHAFRGAAGSGVMATGCGHDLRPQKQTARREGRGGPFACCDCDRFNSAVQAQRHEAGGALAADQQQD